MNLLRHCLIVIIITLCSTITYAESPNIDSSVFAVTKVTVPYAVKEGDTLYLDKYEAPHIGAYGNRYTGTEPKPAVIYLFGGGFYTGHRDDLSYYPYFEFLARKGYVVFSIDYRLGLKQFNNQKLADSKKGKKSSKKSKIFEFVGAFNNSINMAVEDLFSATAYIISHSKEWNIDSSSIIASGSSAGAITVLQAEFYLTNKGINNSTQLLPEKFNYAGIISFAGAILNYHYKLQWGTKAAPIALFHGDADPTVPFNRIWTPWGSFNGSKKIAKSLNKRHFPYLFCIYKEINHKVADLPLSTGHNYIAAFLDNIVAGKQNLSLTIIVEDRNNAVKSKSAEKREKRRELRRYMSGNHSN